jgi:hypothetical protein
MSFCGGINVAVVDGDGDGGEDAAAVELEDKVHCPKEMMMQRLYLLVGG